MKENQEVITISEIKREGVLIPANSKGVIIHVYKDKKAYVVEFLELLDSPVVTMYERDII